MDDNITGIIQNLKEMIDKYGPDFLENNPYMAFENLVKENKKDKVIASAVLMLLSSGTWTKVKNIGDKEKIAETIKRRCCYNKKMADCLTEILYGLYSDMNKTEWKENINKGLKQFIGSQFEVKWEGHSSWSTHTVYMPCEYVATICLKAKNELMNNEKIKLMLKANPFTEKKTFIKYYKDKLTDYLDSEFDDYCVDDDYYPPCVEDFFAYEIVETWCKDNGFELVSFDGNGWDEGYEPY